MESIAKLPVKNSSEVSQFVRKWLQDLVAPHETRPQYLAPHGGNPLRVQGGRLERFSFSSEDGEYIPGLLWTPDARAPNAKTIIIVDDRGKAAVAESGFVQPLLGAGFTVVSVDPRGRGETLGYFGPQWNTNFRLLANQVEFGQPLAGRRAFDLRRAMDYLSLRQEATDDDLTVVGLGDEALPVLLAAAADERIGRVVVAGYFHSFVSQMGARKPKSNREMSESWNDPQVTGRVDTRDYQIDFGSVIPYALENADVPDLAALIAPRRLLFCQARDIRAPGIETLTARFRQVSEAAAKDWLTYDPERPLDAGLLLDWLRLAK